MTSIETRSVVVERDLPCAPEKVWRALTQPHLIEEWMMKNDFMPVVGHRFSLHGGWGGVVECEVLTADPNRSLAYTWNFRHDDPASDLRSVVVFTLTATASGTRLRMEQSGFKAVQRRAFGGARAGWPQFFGRLERLLEATR